MDAGTAQQHVDDALLSVLDGVMERGLALRVLTIDVGPVLYEGGEDL